MQDKDYKVSIFLAFVVPLILVGAMISGQDVSDVGLTVLRPHNAWTYHIYHANWIHLAVNVWVLWGLATRYRYKWWMVIASYIMASLYPFAYGAPIVGMSGIIFCLAGISCVKDLLRPAVGILMMLFAIAVTALIPNVAIGVHLWCYLWGLGIGYISTKI